MQFLKFASMFQESEANMFNLTLGEPNMRL